MFEERATATSNFKKRVGKTTSRASSRNNSSSNNKYSKNKMLLKKSLALYSKSCEFKERLKQVTSRFYGE